jgi:hypothetical protein
MNLLRKEKEIKRNNPEQQEVEKKQKQEHGMGQ